MPEIIGFGLTHYPGLHMLEEDMAVFLRRILSGKRISERAKDPQNWPAEMRAEWADDEGAAAGRAHRERCFAAIRTIRSRLGACRAFPSYAGGQGAGQSGQCQS